MSRKIGVIAEDRTDGDVVRAVIQRVCGSEVGVAIRDQKGCSKIRAKAARLIADLVAHSNVSEVVIIHDLDRDSATGELNDEQRLRSLLAEASLTKDGTIRTHICIPVEELEAWFWSDPGVVKTVGRGRGDAHPNPHKIPKPKEALMRLSRGGNAKPRYTTQDNPSLAKMLDLALCAQRCRSFRELLAFLTPQA